MGFISPPTLEEAVKTPKGWINQRSCWMKGYFQTYCAHMQKPVMPRGKPGLARLVMLQFTIGFTLLAGLLHIPSLCLIIYLIAAVKFHGAEGLFYPVLSVSLLVTYISGLFIGTVGTLRARQPKLIISTFWMPLYWLALFPPTLIALYELKYKPFFWNKTKHGDRDAANPAPVLRQTEHASPI